MTSAGTVVHNFIKRGEPHVFGISVLVTCPEFEMRGGLFDYCPVLGLAF